MSDPTPSCPDEVTLLAHHQGALPAQASAAIGVHVSGCPSCQQRLTERRANATSVQSVETAATVAGAQKAESAAAAMMPRRLERGAAIGRYMVVDQLGEGGMGVVYAAYDPELNRRVAIKLLQAERSQGTESSSTSGGQARLLREAQALAQLSHPNVISVFDVGTFEHRVFVAMELVDGGSIRDWLKEEPRGWREVVKVFTDAGRGLAAAHDAGLIHRDFKPDNVLVGRDGRVRVMDFGLARAAGGGVIEQRSVPITDAPAQEERSNALSTPLTQAGTVMGTPAYMAPEQFAGKPADARVDQFAFGVALYEALYGERPFKSRISAQDPARWQLPPAPRGAHVPGWVRKIALRALAFSADARYPSMTALLEELGRDPLATRRRYAFAGAAVAVVALAAGAARFASESRSAVCRGGEARLAGIWDPARRAQISVAFDRSGRPYARRAFETVSAALEGYAQSWVSSHQDACQATRVRGEQSDEVLSLRMLCFDQRLGELRALSDLFASADADVVEKAIQASGQLVPLQRCADLEALRAPVAPPTDPEVVKQVSAIRDRLADAKARGDAGKFKPGLAIATAAIAEAEKLGYAPLTGEALLLYGWLEERGGEISRAEDALKRAIWVALAGRHDDVATRAAIKLLRISELREDFKLGQLWADQADALVVRMKNEPVLRSEWLNQVGLLRWKEGKLEESIGLLERALALRQQHLGAEHQDTLSTMNNLGILTNEVGRNEESLRYQQQALALRTKTVGPDHPSTGQSHNNLGNVLLDYARFDEALENYRRAATIYEQTLGRDHWRTGLALLNVASVLGSLGRNGEAVVLLERVIAIRVAAYGTEQHSEVASAYQNLATHLLEEGREKEALSAAKKGLTIRQQLGEMDHPDAGYTLQTYAEILVDTGQAAQALPVLQQALAVRDKHLGKDHPLSVATMASLGVAHQHLGAPEEAQRWLRRAIEVGERTLSPDHPDVGGARFHLGRLLAQRGKKAEAIAELGRAAAIYEKTLGPRNPALSRAIVERAELDGSATAAQYEEAIQLLAGYATQRGTIGKARLQLAKLVVTADAPRARQLATQAKAELAQAREAKAAAAAEAFLAKLR